MSVYKKHLRFRSSLLSLISQIVTFHLDIRHHQAKKYNIKIDIIQKMKYLVSKIKFGVVSLRFLPQ